MQLLCTMGRNLVSRQKVLLKRKKAHNKNRPISRMRLREQRKVMNYSHEMKLLQLRKAEDRSKSQNHHLNAIIEELFYPSLPMEKATEVEARVQQLATVGEDLQAIVRGEEIISMLKQYSLPVELLTVYVEKWEEFEAKHYVVLLERISYYCVNRDRIMKRQMEMWEKEVAKLREKEGKRNIKCPFLFLTREEIPRHPLWANMVQNFTKTLQKINNIGQLNFYIEPILIIQRVFYYTPAELYQHVMSRNAAADYSLITPKQISLLLKLLKFRNKLKFSMDIKIDSPEEGQSEQNIVEFARKLVTSVFNSPKTFSSDDFINIFKVINSRKRRIQLLTQQQLAKSEAIITSMLSSLNFEDVLTYFGLYTLLYQHPSKDFMQLLKFDLYRKAHQCKNYNSFLYLMYRIEGRDLVFPTQGQKGTNQPPIRIPAYDLLAKVANNIVTFLPRLKAEELTRIVDSFYANEIEKNEMKVAEVVAAEIVKRGKECSLELLGKTYFKLTLLGHRSKTLSKFIFEQYQAKYQNEMKRLSEEQTFLLPTDQPQIFSTTNLRQIHLQECLIMTVWSLIEQFSDSFHKQINLDQLLLLLPIDLQSREPLIYELTLHISLFLNQYSMFPTIKFKDMVESSNRLNEFYRGNFGKTEVEMLMEEQAKLTGDFINTFNTKQQRFLPQKWSKSKAYSVQQYISHTQKRSPTSYLSPVFKLPESFLTKRNSAIALYMKKNPPSKGLFSRQGKPTPRMYDLL